MRNCTLKLDVQINLWIIYIGKVCKAKLLATAKRNSHYSTCLAHLGQCNRDRIISICIAQPKVAGQVQ